MAKGFGDMMKQARVLQEKMAKMQEELGDKIVESSVGGGMVVAKANGRQELLSIDLEPEVVDPDDIEMLQDLIVAAVNDALKRAQEMAAEEMSKLTGGLKLPGGMKMPGIVLTDFTLSFDSPKAQSVLAL